MRVFPVDLNVSEKAKYMSPLVFFKLVYVRVLQKQYCQSQKVHSQSSAEGNLRQRYCSVSTGVIPQRLHFVAEK